MYCFIFFFFICKWSGLVSGSFIEVSLDAWVRLVHVDWFVYFVQVNGYISNVKLPVFFTGRNFDVDIFIHIRAFYSWRKWANSLPYTYYQNMITSLGNKSASIHHKSVLLKFTFTEGVGNKFILIGGKHFAMFFCSRLMRIYGPYSVFQLLIWQKNIGKCFWHWSTLQYRAKKARWNRNNFWII